MNILGTQYNLHDRAFEIYVAGCNSQPHCKGCHNPESWDFDGGYELTTSVRDKIYKKISRFNTLIDRIYILGGEPLDNDIDALIEIVEFLADNAHKEIWLFTRYGLYDLPSLLGNKLILFAYIKCGVYDDTKLSDEHYEHGIKLASTNQHVFKRGIDYM